jgi:hypothetical protein
MQQILRLLGTRYVIALLLAVLVVGVVATTRFLTGSTHSTVVVESQPTVSTDAAPTGSADAADDDSVASQDTPQPSTSPGALSPETVATRFTAAWLHHTGLTGDQWRAGLKPYATEALMTELKDTDPAGVPAERVVGTVQVINRDGDRVDVAIPLDSGRLSLRLFATNGRWFVDGVDWERA